MIGKVIGYDKGIKSGSTDCEMLGTILGNKQVYDKLESLFIGDSIEGTAWLGLTWSGVHVLVVGWMFGSVGFHATSKGMELSCELDYTISS